MFLKKTKKTKKAIKKKKIKTVFRFVLFLICKYFKEITIPAKGVKNKNFFFSNKEDVGSSFATYTEFDISFKRYS